MHHLVLCAKPLDNTLQEDISATPYDSRAAGPCYRDLHELSLQVGGKGGETRKRQGSNPCTLASTAFPTFNGETPAGVPVNKMSPASSVKSWRERRRQRKGLGLDKEQGRGLSSTSSNGKTAVTDELMYPREHFRVRVT